MDIDPGLVTPPPSALNMYTRHQNTWDLNQAGTLRYAQNFKAVGGCYSGAYISTVHARNSVKSDKPFFLAPVPKAFVLGIHDDPFALLYVLAANSRENISFNGILVLGTRGLV